MPNLNKVMLMGNLVRDAELRYLPGGQSVLEFRMAITRKYRTAQGEDKEETCFVDINLWGKRGEALSQYLTKGKPLFVEGRLQLDEWDDKETGAKRSKLRVVAENVEFLGGGRGSQPSEQGENGAGGYQRPANSVSRTIQPPASAPRPPEPYPRPAPSAPAPATQIQDEEIPF
jgi:single-strand DNA-binding protein